ncbi:DUF1758 domain-containing protein [Trichonephila clavipes]|nr:DUF1758 domain-containing protein [Trichonephila clavipes]
MLVRLSWVPVLSGGLRCKTQLFSGTLYMAASSKTLPHKSKDPQKFNTPLQVPFFPGSSLLCHHTNSEKPSDTTSFHSVLKKTKLEQSSLSNVGLCSGREKKKRVEELIVLEDVDICQLEVKLNVFKGKVDRLENTHSNILELLPEKDNDAEFGVVEDFRDKAIRIQTKARRIVNSQQNVLEVLGISDPVEIKNKRERENLTKLHFEETVRINTEGRYEVSLPWKENHFPIPSNKDIAMKRLESLTKKLHQETLFTAYDVFKEWELLGTIENDPVDSSPHLHGHYLPHRPVVKQHGTTKIRLVFDASARQFRQCEAEILPSIEESHYILAEEKFNLRGWKYTGDDDPEQVTSVLELIWNRKEDELKMNLDWIETYKLEIVSKSFRSNSFPYT